LKFLPEDNVMAERDPDVSEPVVRLVVPEKEVHRRDVLHPLLALLQIGFDVLEIVKSDCHGDLIVF